MFSKSSKNWLRNIVPRAMEGLPPFTAGVGRYSPTTSCARLENIGEHADGDLDLPLRLMFFDRVLAFDHRAPPDPFVGRADVTREAPRVAV